MLYHTSSIADIARYIVANIELPLDAAYSGSLGWHTRPRWRSTRFRDIFVVFHFPIMLTVIVPTGAALTLAWQYDGPVGVKVPLAVLDGVLVAFYVIQYLRRITKPLVAKDAATESRG